MNTMTWYAALTKPMWAPPAWLFGPVWSVLYLIIFVSFGSVFVRVYRGEIPPMVAVPFVLNLIFNAAFSPIQFRLQNNLLASIDILLIFGTILWMFVAIWPYMRGVVYANIPYLLWVSFATILQLSITWLNR
jgi:translocator protein